MKPYVIHLWHFPKGYRQPAACGTLDRGTRPFPITLDRNKVTCKRCLKWLANRSSITIHLMEQGKNRW